MPKPDRSCVHPGCGQIRSGARHGLDGDHEFEAPPRAGFGSQRKPIRARSEKQEDYYREERRPAVEKAVGDGRRPCQMRIEGVCTRYVQGIHESATRGRFGGLRAGFESGPTFDACHACNDWCSTHPVEARERGFLLSNRGETARNTQPPRPEPPPPAQSRTRRPLDLDI